MGGMPPLVGGGIGCPDGGSPRGEGAGSLGLLVGQSGCPA